MLTENNYGPLPPTTNKFRQGAGSNDCGIAGLHKLESIMMENRGEGVAKLYPNPKAWRTRLQSMCKVLNKEADELAMRIHAQLGS